MAIVDMRIGDPLECDEPPDTVVFLLPTMGWGRGYATRMVEYLEDETRPLGETQAFSLAGCDYYGVVSHDGDDYSRAPIIMEDFLDRLRETRRKKSAVVVVISGRDMPVDVRFEFMATLARAKKHVKLFDFPSS